MQKRKIQKRGNQK